MCVCEALGIQLAMRVRHIVIFDLFDLSQFFILYNKKHEFREKIMMIYLLTALYVCVSVHHNSILYKEPTRCNFGSIVY